MSVKIMDKKKIATSDGHLVGYYVMDTLLVSCDNYDNGILI